MRITPISSVTGPKVCAAQANEDKIETAASNPSRQRKSLVGMVERPLFEAHLGQRNSRASSVAPRGLAAADTVAFFQSADANADRSTCSCLADLRAVRTTVEHLRCQLLQRATAKMNTQSSLPDMALRLHATH